MRTILIVEDDPDVVEMVRDALAAEGIHSVGVRDPDEVETVARQTAPDVFLIDLMLEGKCGVETAQELRDHGFDAPIVGMSGSAYLAEVARETGLFEAVLDKPFDIDALLLSLLESAAA
jgi:two-component system, OmpR family, response regulator